MFFDAMLDVCIAKLFVNKMNLKIFKSISSFFLRILKIMTNLMMQRLNGIPHMKHATVIKMLICSPFALHHCLTSFLVGLSILGNVAFVLCYPMHFDLCLMSS